MSEGTWGGDAGVAVTEGAIGGAGCWPRPAREADAVPARTPTARFRPDVQGLRALAVIPVVLFHFGFGLLPGGFTGVDLFFCISGFVIAQSIVDDIDAGRFSIAGFYFKRTRRILPALVATMLVTTGAAAAILLPEDLGSYFHSLLATDTFWSNMYFWKASGYFGAEAQTQPLLHTWSLAVEEQYYVVAPIAFAAIARWGRRRWLTFLMPVTIASFFVCVATVFVAPLAGFFLLPARAWELLIGAMVALYRTRRPIGAGTAEWLAAAGLLLIAIAMVGIHESDPFPGWNALLPCLGAAAILVSGRGEAGVPLVGRLLSVRPLLWIGNISYSLYLVHWPIAALTQYATLVPPTPFRAALMLAASILLAFLSWRYVEQPWRHIDRRHHWRVLGGGAAMIFLVAAGAEVGIAGNGFPGRFPGYTHRVIPGTEEWGGPHCFTTDPAHSLSWDASACTRIHGRHGRILLWGDSFAAQYAPGIVRDARRIDADVLQYSFAGCPPILSYFAIARMGCVRSNHAVLGLIAREHVDTVVLSARWSETPRRELVDLHRTIAALKAMGLRVVVFGQSPEFATDVQQIDFKSGQYRYPGVVQWREVVDPQLNDIVRREARGATFVDPLALLCSDGRCPYRSGSNFLYSDYGHFSSIGSAIAVRRYFPAGDPSRNNR